MLENDEVCSSINVVFDVYSQSTLGCLGFLNVSTNDKISTVSLLWRTKFVNKKRNLNGLQPLPTKTYTTFVVNIKNLGFWTLGACYDF